MKIGVMIGADGTSMTIDDVVDTVKDLEQRGNAHLSPVFPVFPRFPALCPIR